MLAPSPAHRYPVEHAERLHRTFHALTGRDLIDPTLSPEAANRQGDAQRPRLSRRRARGHP
ncbi:MAG: hypothetical protein WAW42_01230 [Candidatus Competibacteraceae bacterium]